MVLCSCLTRRRCIVGMTAHSCRRRRRPLCAVFLLLATMLLCWALFLAVYGAREKCSEIGCGEWKRTKVTRRGTSEVAGARNENDSHKQPVTISSSTQYLNLTLHTNPPPSTSHPQSTPVAPGNNNKPHPPPPPLSAKFQNLTSEQIESVETFLFFVGYGRSGHSLVASILDAHPNIIIAHEYYLFDKLSKLYENSVLTKKSGLFDELYWSSYTSAVSGWRANVSTSKGYNLEIPGMWQGRFEKLKVIGDKTGGSTAMLYWDDPRTFRYIFKYLQRTVGVPIKAVHVVRNPFDMIATAALYQASTDPDKRKVKASAEKKFSKRIVLAKAVNLVLKKAMAVSKMAEDTGLSLLEIHLEDLNKDPRRSVESVCEYLSVECSEEYLTACERKVNSNVTRSRDVVVWSRALVDKVVKATHTLSFFKRYSFEGS